MKAGPSPTASVSEVTEGSHADSELDSRWGERAVAVLECWQKPVCRSLSPVTSPTP